MSDEKHPNREPVNPTSETPTPGADADATLPIDPDAKDATPGPTGEADIGSTIGPYRLVARLGEGGMGEVFLAEQTEPIRRRVALKVIKPGMDSRSVVARFEAERQALALMDHPVIARVIEAGTTDRGRPYFVMDYVDGEPINRYCDRHRLSTEERLELLIRICEGIQHAHQKAVIHRDLKPSNILVAEVDGRPEPKIIDFGVAKATEQPLAGETLYTAMGQIVGTPEYMSPEQALGTDIDTRTDVYALGVVLYELLAGSLPFPTTELRSEGVTGIQRIISEQEPPRPSTRVSKLGEKAAKVAEHRRAEPRRLTQTLKGDLDWITLKALAKERERRYETANGLAMDLRRYLDNEPVLATPPSAAYRLGKLTRRHRGAVVALAAIFGVLAGATVVSSSLYLRAERESRRARTEAAKSEQVSKFLTDMLAGAGPAAARGRDTAMLREILDETDERLGIELEDQPEVEAELRNVLALTYVDLAEYETAKRQALRRVALMEEQYGPTHPETAEAIGQVGKVSMFLGELATSDSLLAWADSTISAQRGSDDPEAVYARANRTEVLSYVGDLDEAARLAEDVLSRDRDDSERIDESIMMALFTLAAVRSDEQRYTEADSLYGELIPRLESLVGPEHPNTLTTRTSRAMNLTFMGDFERAEEIATAALADQRRILGSDHRQTQIAVNNLAILYSRMGRVDEAEVLYRETIEVGLATWGPLHPEQLTGEVNFATFLGRNGRCDEALTFIADLLPRLNEAMGPDFLGTAYALRAKGGCLRELGRDSEAVPALKECHRLFELFYGPEDDRTLEAAREAEAAAAVATEPRE